MIKYLSFFIFALLTLVIHKLSIIEENGLNNGGVIYWPFPSLSFIWEIWTYFKPLSDGRSDGVHLAVAISSHLENFEQRAAIRATWKKLKSPNTAFYFVIPDQPCPIGIDPYIQVCCFPVSGTAAPLSIHKFEF
jgi:hypothetical protein